LNAAAASAASIEVPDPQNGSKTTSPASENAVTISITRSLAVHRLLAIGEL
jgi:hypothetical protein